MVNLTNPWCNSKSMTNPWPCWRCRPKTHKMHPLGGCVEPKFARARNPWPILDHADDADQKRKNRTRKAGASNRVDTCGGGKIWIKLENNRIHDHRIDKLWENATKMSHFPNTSISGILEYWKVSWSTLSNNSIFREISWQFTRNWEY